MFRFRIYTQGWGLKIGRLSFRWYKQDNYYSLATDWAKNSSYGINGGWTIKEWKKKKEAENKRKVK